VSAPVNYSSSGTDCAWARTFWVKKDSDAPSAPVQLNSTLLLNKSLAVSINAILSAFFLMKLLWTATILAIGTVYGQNRALAVIGAFRFYYSSYSPNQNNFQAGQTVHLI
jgi:hypothetical protein